MANPGRIFEAQRLLRRIDDRDAECSRWLVQALESIADVDSNMPVKCVLLHIYNALPNARLNEKEKELLSA
jgi:mannose/cellobiose epimerase-like protein (N-acyl-D-glucosamine 2-epimerase family)